MQRRGYWRSEERLVQAPDGEMAAATLGVRGIAQPLDGLLRGCQPPISGSLSPPEQTV